MTEHGPRSRSAGAHAGCLLAAVLVLAACPGPTTPDVPALVLTTVVVSLNVSTIQVGQTAVATASGFDQNGAAMAVGTVTWTTASPNVATVGVGGIVTAAAAGQTAVIATAGIRQGQQVITVTAPVASVTITPSSVTLAIGASQQFTAATLDANGAALTGRVVTFALSDPTKASVSTTGLVTALAAGVVTVTATSEGKSASAVITIGSTTAVATVTVAPATASLVVGGTQALVATARDANGNILSGRVFTWTSSDLSKATGTFSGGNATVTAVSAGTVTINAVSEGKVGASIITISVAQVACTGANALQMTLGQVVTLSAAQKASLCLGGAAAAEYVLIPFSHTGVAAALVQVDLTATNTSAVTATPLTGQAGFPNIEMVAERERLLAAGESAFRRRERREIAPLLENARATRNATGPADGQGPSALTSTPTVGQVISLNSSGSEGCTNPRVRSARIVSLSQRAIVMVETTAPSGGYTDGELTAFGTGFDAQVYALDVLNFGAPVDIDGNGRIGIFFTTGVNVLTTDPTQGVVGGFFFSRDLVSVAQCPGSNFGEMFYMPVPDPNSTINGSYKDKASLTNKVIATLAHEFQHLINSERRQFVNIGAAAFEETWLNEGLSHIAEELLYYQQSGQSARTNLGIGTIGSSQAQVDAFNTYAVGNFGRLFSYLATPETNPPYAQNDALATRGAIWQLLRYAADRKGGNESSAWFSLVNSLTVGQNNFNAVFGDIVSQTRDFAVAQFTDDAGLSPPAIYTHPSWNFRSLFPALTTPARFPLATVSLLSGSPRTITLSGGGAAYVRFRVAGSLFATVVGTSSGQPLPSSVDFILVRTQ